MKDAAGGRHPIRVVEQRTGLTSATIRAWERRYEAVQPVRSDGGQRLYSDQDVAHLRTLKALTDGGRGISSVAALSPVDAEALLTEDLSATATQESGMAGASPGDQVDEAYDRVRALDDSGLERVLWRALVTHGARALLAEVLGPLLRRVGEGWESGDITPGHEHLASEVVEQLLERLVDRVRPPKAPIMVVSTLPGERHGLGARLASAAASLDGWNVVYLGTDLPVEEVAMAVTKLRARAVAISVVRGGDTTSSAHELARLRELLDARTRLFVGGSGVADIPEALMPTGLIQIVGLEGFAAHRREA
jgi:methanogenic corrinoid protein MtbC1